MKKFLKEFYAEEYQGVEVEYVRGKPAVLTVIDEDGDQVEDVNLFDFTTLESLHLMMDQKGFVKKSEEDIKAMRSVKAAEAQAEIAKREAEKAERQERARAKASGEEL